MRKQLTIEGNTVDNSVIDKIRKEKANANIEIEVKSNVETNIETNIYNKKVICLNIGMNSSQIVLNFKADFMDDMVESFTSIYNWMVNNHFDALNLGDGVLIYRNSIDEVVNVMKKLNGKL